MMSFTFKAPTLYESKAKLRSYETPHEEPVYVFDRLGKIKKIVNWLREKLKKDGFTPGELFIEPGGWCFEFKAPKGPVLCLLSNFDSDCELVNLLIPDSDGVNENIAVTFENIFSKSPEIVGLDFVRQTKIIPSNEEAKIPLLIAWVRNYISLSISTANNRIGSLFKIFWWRNWCHFGNGRNVRFFHRVYIQ